MKVILKVPVNTNVVEKRLYPYIGRSTASGVVVFFVDYRKGTSLTEDVECQYSETWEESLFEPFKGSITLSND